jgi:hypothetical protein
MWLEFAMQAVRRCLRAGGRGRGGEALVMSAGSRENGPAWPAGIWNARCKPIPTTSQRLTVQADNDDRVFLLVEKSPELLFFSSDSPLTGRRNEDD